MSARTPGTIPQGIRQAYFERPGLFANCFAQRGMMPTVEWNKRWGGQITEHLQSNQDFWWGYQWGNPQRRTILSTVLERYLSPYVRPDQVAMEIGPGGGRWTQFLVGVKELVLVELNPEFFDYLGGRFAAAPAMLRFYQTRDTELDGVENDSIDFVFSFGVFVHIDPADIASYLRHLHRVLRSGGRAVIQYADKTKAAALENDSFSDMNAEKMEAFVVGEKFQIEAHDTTLVGHSNIIVLTKPAPSVGLPAPTSARDQGDGQSRGQPAHRHTG